MSKFDYGKIYVTGFLGYFTWHGVKKYKSMENPPSIQDRKIFNDFLLKLAEERGFSALIWPGAILHETQVLKFVSIGYLNFVEYLIKGIMKTGKFIVKKLEKKD